MGTPPSDEPGGQNERVVMDGGWTVAMDSREGGAAWGDSWGASAAGERPFSSPRGEAEPSGGDWQGEPFGVGRVFSQSFSLLGEKPLFYYSLSMIACLPGVLLQWGGDGKRALLQYVVDMFLTVIFTGAISYGVYQHLTGGRVTIVQAIGKGLARYFSLVGVSFLWTVMLFAALLCTVFAAILSPVLVVFPLAGLLYMVVIFMVAVPACVVEGKGAAASLERSVNLSWKRRGSIFGVIILYGLIALVAKLAGDAVFGAGNAVGVVDIFTTPLYVCLYQVLTVTAYYQLRVAREGVSVDRLATIFD